MKKTTPVPVLIFILAVFQICIAGDVSGYFKTVKKGEIKPATAAAFPDRSPGDPLRKVTVVVLSEGTMDPQAVLETLDPYTALINQEGMQNKNYISFWVRPDGYVSMNATFSDGNVQYIDSTEGEDNITAQALVAELTENSPDRIAGRIHTGKAVTTSSRDTYELDVRFDTPVSRPRAGEDLGETGGEPGKAMTMLLAAMKNRDWKGIQSTVTTSKLESLVYQDATDEENFESVVGSISLILPKGKARVIGGEQIGDTAILELEGEMIAGDAESKALYLIRMVREAQSWRFDRARVAGFF